MIKLLVGVILLIVILSTSYYILVENDQIVEEHFQQSCSYIGAHNILENASEDDPFSDECCSEFMENQDDFYTEYKNAVNAYPNEESKEYKDVHYRMLSKCVKNELDTDHHTGSLLPQSDNNSHCEIYTDKCFSGKEISIENYPSQANFIDSNVENLAMCHVDPNCKFQDHSLESCSNKCIRELDISEGKDCNSDGCSDTIPNYSLKGGFCEQLNDEETCNNTEYCEYDGNCRFKCYNLDEDQCNQHSDICYSVNNNCYPRFCGPNEGNYLRDEKRNQHCKQICNVNEDDCPSKTGDECKNDLMCDHNSFVVPKCVADNS
jgi:hypothetical protein